MRNDGDFTYLRVDESKMDFSVKEIRMGVDNVAGGNPVIRKLIDSRRMTSKRYSFSRVFMICRGRIELVHQQQRTGTAERNEAGAKK